MLNKNQPGPYPTYFHKYMVQLPETDIFTLLREQPQELKQMLINLSEETAAQSYAAGKWSVKEVIGHLLDTERVFLYRCMCISRGEKLSLPGFDEDAYVSNAYFNQRTLASLLTEYNLQRQATIAFYYNLNPEVLSVVGRSNDQEISVKAQIMVTAAHERHHLNILKERYGAILK